MPTNRNKISVNRTLLILLGILLAFLLTMNAKSFTAETLSFPKPTTTETIDKNAEAGLIDNISPSSVKNLLKKFHL